MEFWKILIILKEIKKPSDKFGDKPIKIWTFWENFNIYMQ